MFGILNGSVIALHANSAFQSVSQDAASLIHNGTGRIEFWSFCRFITSLSNLLPFPLCESGFFFVNLFQNSEQFRFELEYFAVTNNRHVSKLTNARSHFGGFFCFVDIENRLCERRCRRVLA